MGKTALKTRIHCHINDEPHELEVFPMARLLDVLREDVKLTGTKEGCGEGECGACSILLNGNLVNSCLVPALQADGSQIKTVEGVANPSSEKQPQASDLHPVQEAFLKFGGAQCGICTPGMVLATCSLLERNPNPTDAEIREGLAGNICRCTGYIKIFESIKNLIEARQA